MHSPKEWCQNLALFPLIRRAAPQHKEKDVMQRMAVNPWDWSVRVGYNQAEVIEGAMRHLICAGQAAVDGAGAPQHHGDMRGQIGLALDNLERVLAAAGMTLGNVTRLVVYATDVDAALRNFDVMGLRFAPHGVAPPLTLLGVTRLALPDLMFEIEAMAAA
jgi:enamine deaminase RidA (YjgF/YER057c/UK114 family)